MTPEKQMRLAALITLKTIRLGTVITEEQMKAFRSVLGPTLDKVPEPKVLLDVRFGPIGEQIVNKGAGLIK